jgi:hypothetical protein
MGLQAPKSSIQSKAGTSTIVEGISLYTLAIRV